MSLNAVRTDPSHHGEEVVEDEDENEEEEEEEEVDEEVDEEGADRDGTDAP